MRAMRGTSTTVNTTMTETRDASQRSNVRQARPAGTPSPRVKERLEREARARRALFIASVAGLAATLSVVVISAGPPQGIDAVKPPAANALPAQRIVAQVPIQPAEDQTGVVTFRLGAPVQDAPQPDVRTRATP